MKISELKSALAANPEYNLRFVLPDGARVPAHAHVTEVARVEKRFVDCGGTLRNDVFCRLQTWVADDLHHRLNGGKLLGILAKAATILGPEDLDVDIEHEAGWISQFPLASCEPSGSELVLQLTARHTACLAEDRCMRPPSGLAAFNPQAISFQPRTTPTTSQ